MGSSSETLPSDGGTTSGCNIVYESLIPDKSANKCFVSSDGGKRLNDNNSSACGASGIDKLSDLEKTNVPGATSKNSNKATFNSARDVKPSISNKSTENLGTNENESSR